MTEHDNRKALVDEQWRGIEPVVACQLRAQLRSKEAADDITHDVYVALMESDEVRPGADLLKLACTLARRIAKRKRQQRWRHLDLLKRHSHESELRPKQTMLPDQVHAWGDLLATIERVLLEFPADVRSIFKAHVDGAAGSEIAAHMRIQQQKVYRLIERVHTRILKELPTPGEREP